MVYETCHKRPISQPADFSSARFFSNPSVFFTLRGPGLKLTYTWPNSRMNQTMEPQLLITHPGSAHFDDVTAVSLILATYPGSKFKIERREPTEEELENPKVWVVDVGDRYQPETRNFDHHQALDCPAGFVLVAKYLGLAETLSVMPWWYFKDSVDRIGPTRSSQIFHAGDDLVNRNPVEDWLTDRFASRPQTSLSLLRSFGAYIIESARRLETQINFWKAARRFVVAGVPVAIGETRESFGLEEFRRLESNPPDIIISLDRRSEGWRLYRYEGTPVDFSLIANRPEIEFAHKSGFLAKTKERLPIDELIALVGKAIIRR